MRIFKIKQVAETVGLSKKEIKSILIGMRVITGSWAVNDGQDLVVELNVFQDKDTLTTPFLTEKCVNLLQEIAVAKELNQHRTRRVITQEMFNEVVDHLFEKEATDV